MANSTSSSKSNSAGASSSSSSTSSSTHNKRDVFVKWGFRISSGIIVGSLLFCGYWLVLDRDLPIEVHSGEVIEYERQPDKSWIMIVEWKGELKRRCGGNSKRWLVDGFRLPLVDFPYPAEMESQPLGSFTWQVPIHVPSYFVSTGHTSGHYRARFLYECNRLQEIVFPIVSEPPAVPFAIPVDSVSPLVRSRPKSAPVPPQ